MSQPPEEVMYAMRRALVSFDATYNPQTPDERIRYILAAAEQAGWRLVPASEEYLVWSNQHRMWWRPGSKGYTPELAEAGRYSRDEAIKISRGGDFWRAFERPREVPVLASDAAMLNAAPKVTP